MKICYISDAESEHTRRWTEHFASLGHEVHLIDYNNIQFKNVKTHVLSIPNIKGLKLPVKAYKLRNVIKEINPDIVHVHGISDLSYSFAFINFHPLVVTPWGSDVLIHMKNSRSHRFFATQLLKKADVIAPESEYMKKDLMTYNISPEKILVHHWGIDTKIFNVQDNQKMDEDLKRNIPLNVISTRRFLPVFDVETLIRAIPGVVNEIPNARFILKYREFAPDLKQFEEFKKLAQSIGILNHINFLGEIDYNELPKYLNASDIYVSTSLSDSCSVSMLEAMACGLPVVVSDEPSNFEWIKDGWNGYIFPRKDHEALAEKLIMLLKDKEKRELFGKRNREIIEERGDWNKNMEKVEQLYENLIDKYKNEICDNKNACRRHRTFEKNAK